MVDAKSGRVLYITLFTDIQKMGNAKLLDKYSNCKFYIGLLKDSYEIKDDDIVPKENTTVIMYTEIQIFPEEYFYPTDDLSPVDAFDLGKPRPRSYQSKKEN